jgi:hypothetical protein
MGVSEGSQNPTVRLDERAHTWGVLLPELALDRRCLAFGRQLEDSDGEATWRDGNLAVALGCADPRATDGVQFGVQIADNVLAAVFEIYAATVLDLPPSSVVS